MPRTRSTEATEELRSSLIGHALRLMEREGADALTMRALAAEAGCAVGLPYKVFANREELLAELVAREFVRLRVDLDDLVASAGSGTIAGNLTRYARTLLETETPAFALAMEIGNDALSQAVDAKADETGLLASFESTVADYLAAEKALGRIDSGVDEQAFGFLVTGAIHNLLISGRAYPRPDARQLATVFEAVAGRLVSDPTPR